MVQRTHKWCRVAWNGLALCRITLQNIRRSIWTLNCLALHEIFRCCGESSSLLVAWRVSPKPPKIQTANGTVICWGHDVIECEDCREIIRWCSHCVEESSLCIAVKQSQFSEFLLFFPRRYCIYSLSFMEALIKITTRLDPTTFFNQTCSLPKQPFFRVGFIVRHTN